jgi:signal transduction histidine kinase
MIDRLAALPALADVPRPQLQWLLDHGEVHSADDGAIFRAVGEDELVGLFLLISGRFSIRVDRGGVEREVREVTPGRVTGFLPYSRMTVPRGYVVADGPVEFLFIELEDIKEMTRACYEFTAACVHEMLDRARVFKSDDKRQEKMAALGRLSAGLAHELNNPASAAARAARVLDTARAELVGASRDLGAAGLDDTAMQALESLESAAGNATVEPLSPVALVELEDRIMEWMEGRGVDTHLAYPLAECGVTVDDLDAAAPAFDAESLPSVLRYLAADCAVRGLMADISSSTERIHSLVAAVKKHTHMDRAPVEPIRLEEHLSDAVTLMSSKASLKDVSVELSVEADLPAVEASVSELNQVWMHLVDNAIDAAPESGRIAIDARRDHDRVVVRVIDDGPGIPEERQERVFEPFFTTKEVGEGRGLGLDVVRTVVLSHRGTVDLASSPGRTEFRVTLPASDAHGRGG